MASGRNRGKKRPERRVSCPGRKWAQWILLLSANGNISLSTQISPFARAGQVPVAGSRKKTANRAADFIGEK